MPVKFSTEIEGHVQIRYWQSWQTEEQGIDLHVCDVCGHISKDQEEHSQEHLNWRREQLT